MIQCAGIIMWYCVVGITIWVKTIIWYLILIPLFLSLYLYQDILKKPFALIFKSRQDLGSKSVYKFHTSSVYSHSSQDDSDCTSSNISRLFCIRSITYGRIEGISPIMASYCGWKSSQCYESDEICKYEFFQFRRRYKFGASLLISSIHTMEYKYNNWCIVGYIDA